MVWLTHPDPTDVFVDPMCGSGTILAERMLAAPYAEVRGGDLAAQSVKATLQNLNTPHKPFHVQAWDARDLPLAAASVDKLAANLPFGKQIGSPAEIRRLYPAFFRELSRVLKPGGLATVLSSEYELIKTTLRREPQLEIQTGYSIATLGQWGRLYIIKKKAG
jgi:23S rRNA G2445 N2-methylase RlmL